MPDESSMSNHELEVTEHAERPVAIKSTSASCSFTAPKLPNREHVEKDAASRTTAIGCRDILCSFLIVAGGCVILLLIVREPFVVSPDALLWIAILWVTSIGVGHLFQWIGVPPLLGSLAVGIVLRNGVEDFDLPRRFTEMIENVGLCVILLISSMEIDVNAVVKAGSISLRLTFLPGLVEAVICAVSSHWLFNMPLAFALSLGFILAAVSPAVVLPGMSRLQRLGFGIDKGIPSIVMAACAMDDIVAITGYTICIGVAFDGYLKEPSPSNLAMSAFLHGPVSVFLGILAGCVGGIILAMTRLCPCDWQRTVVALELALLMTYGYKRAGFDGSGAIATLLMGTVAKLVWKQKRVIECTQYSGTDFLEKIGIDIDTIVWTHILRPMLFGGIGSALDFAIIRESIFKSVAVVIIGLTIRLPTAFVSTYGLKTKERLFIASAWTPKATVQAALAAHALSVIETQLKGDNRSQQHDNYNELIDWGTKIMSTSIIAIVITVPVGLLSIQFLGPYLLSKTPPVPKK